MKWRKLLDLLWFWAEAGLAALLIGVMLAAWVLIAGGIAIQAMFHVIGRRLTVGAVRA